MSKDIPNLSIPLLIRIDSPGVGTSLGHTLIKLGTGPGSDSEAAVMSSVWMQAAAATV